MLKTLMHAVKMIWLGANTLSLKIRVILYVICGAGVGFVSYYSTYYLSLLVKTVTDSDTAHIMKYLYIFIALAAATVVFRFVARRFTEYTSTPIANNVKMYYYNKILNKDYDWHLHNSVGYLSSMLDRVTRTITNWGWKVPYDYMPGFLLLTLFLIYTFSVSVWLFLYFVVCMLILIGLIRLTLSHRMKLDKQTAQTNSRFTKTFVDFLYNIRSVKKMNLTTFTNQKIHQDATHAEKQVFKTMRFNAYQWMLMEIFVRAQFLIPLTYFIYQLVHTGQGIEIVVMLVGTQSQMDAIGRQIMHLMTELGTAKQEFALLSEHLGDTSVNDGNIDKHKWDKIEFNNTYFSFIADSNKFEHRIDNLVINRGDHIAVMGKSGEGKSTFFNLLTRQYSPKSGTILVDDTDYHNMSSKWFNREMMYVSQDIELFDMSFKDNICMGKKVSAKQMQEIIDGCCLNELVDRLHGNLDADIGEKGVKLSGGEKQRVNLARSLLMNRQILILDEITANLDPTTTKKIWQFIFNKYGDKTIIAISHEPELLQHVNKRFVFKNGRGTEYYE